MQATRKYSAAVFCFYLNNKLLSLASHKVIKAASIAAIIHNLCPNLPSFTLYQTNAIKNCNGTTMHKYTDFHKKSFLVLFYPEFIDGFLDYVQHFNKNNG
jgi:hypothetical protein